MNEQYEQLILFREQLIRFNEALKSSMIDLQNSHDYVDRWWRDDMRKAYDHQWEPLKEMMNRYINHEGRAYVEFLSIKIHKLEQYLRER